jgi:hypothetical protein
VAETVDKKRPTFLEWLALLYADEDWGDDEWERWEGELYCDDPTAPVPSFSVEEMKEGNITLVLHPFGKAAPSAEESKAIKDWKSARTARLAPGFAKLGMTCYDVGLGLRHLLDFEDRTVRVMLTALLETLRVEAGRGRGHRVDALNIIADMLDPEKPGRWKLELRRNVRGAPSEKSGSYYHWVALEYFELFEELKSGACAPRPKRQREDFSSNGSGYPRRNSAPR